MSNKGLFRVPHITNEPVLNYRKDSPEKKKVKIFLSEMLSNVVDIPMYIGKEEIYTSKKISIYPPHDRTHLLGYFNEGGKRHVERAIESAMYAKKQWMELSWERRSAIFLKAADLIAGPYRAKINAATMLGQSKSIFQAEIDAACELIDFFRFNVEYMYEIYAEQSLRSPSPTWNRIEQRPLEGFIFAVTPFNFTSIAANLACAPALMGNTVIWKPNFTQIYSARVVIEVLQEAGLPAGVINLIYVDGPKSGEVIFQHPDFAGLHFTGSTTVFRNLWKIIGQNIRFYRSYPRIVGETGGKDFIVAHDSAQINPLVTALLRGAFEYQGQKCSAVSRAYIPSSLWKEVKTVLLKELSTMRMGTPEDFTNFINAVIDRKAFQKIVSYIEQGKHAKETTLVAGGNYDDSKGFFIEPTIFETTDPKYITMCEEIFGPVLTIYVYSSESFEEILELVNNTSSYALTGAVFARDAYAIDMAIKKLEYAAGNFYVNDKPTGAVVGQQPFGGGRTSGTNDKAGAKLNLLRWVTPRIIKENFNPPENYTYPFMKDK